MSAAGISTRPAVQASNRSAANAAPSGNEIVFTRTVTIGATGEQVKAGTRVGEVAKRPWFTDIWRADAIACGTLGLPEPESTDDQE